MGLFLEFGVRFSQVVCRIQPICQMNKNGHTNRKTGILQLGERLRFQSYRSDTTLSGSVNPNRYGQVV
jgi:hypothetical protein